MLITFTFSNFLSYKDKQTIDLTSAPLKAPQGNIHTASLHDPDLSLLKFMAIYGHNNHGKTNFIKAYRFFVDLIFHSYSFRKNDRFIDVDKFGKDGACNNEPSVFEIVFIRAETKYRYGFEVARHKVVKEWLYYTEPKIRENYLFTRDEEKFRISKLWNKLSDDRVEQAVYDTRAHHLFLSVLFMQENISRIDVIKNWLKGNIISSDVLDKEDLHKAMSILIHEEFRETIFNFIEDADLGLVNIQEKFIDGASCHLPFNNDEKVLPKYGEVNECVFCSGHPSINDAYKHTTDQVAEWLNTQSSGTIKYFILSCFLGYAVKKGQLVFIDELDSKLHILLLKFLLKTFSDGELNTSGSQLIFTAHDPEPLFCRSFRRDQFMIVEKNREGISSLHRMYNFKTPMRIDASPGKEYLKGKVGGVSSKLSLMNEQ